MLHACFVCHLRNFLAQTFTFEQKLPINQRWNKDWVHFVFVIWFSLASIQTKETPASGIVNNFDPFPARENPCMLFSLLSCHTLKMCFSHQTSTRRVTHIHDYLGLGKYSNLPTCQIWFGVPRSQWVRFHPHSSQEKSASIFWLLNCERFHSSSLPSLAHNKFSHW